MNKPICITNSLVIGVSLSMTSTQLNAARVTTESRSGPTNINSSAMSLQVRSNFPKILLFMEVILIFWSFHRMILK